MSAAVRWWPPIGVAAMLLLGWAVGKGAVGVDQWFQRYGDGPTQRLLFFTDPRILAPLWLVAAVLAMYRRRWRLLALVVMLPPLAYGIVQLLKRLFGREKEGGLAYPSGHTTVMVVVLGMLVLVAGAGLWALLVAIVYSLLGMLGQAVTYHYFTDAVGALLLGTAIVCVAARLDRCQPRGRPRHSES